jgi:hypothetical protein
MFAINELLKVARRKDEGSVNALHLKVFAHPRVAWLTDGATDPV